MKLTRVLIVACICVCATGCYEARDSKQSSDPATHQTSLDPAIDKITIRLNTDPDAIAQKSAAFLWEKQSDDGAWRSETYGLLGSGQSLTPFVLHALLKSSSGNPPSGAIVNALEFMRSQISERGVLGEFDPEILEYPNYSTAFALMCFKQVSDEKDAALIGPMEDYLFSEQFCESTGFDVSSPAYGGWGFGGSHSPGETGHMDLAHTRYVLQALSMKPVDIQRLAATRSRAVRFLSMVQKQADETRTQPMPKEIEARPVASAGFDGGFDAGFDCGFDGGFYFSPIVLRANKGRLDTSGEIPFWQSYATATCEGLLALTAAGVAREDKRTVAAVEWLGKYQNLNYPEGIQELYNGENWRDAVYFYHLAVRGESARLLTNDSSIRKKIALQLADRQNPDGSFQNRDSSLMKEDDPILCTALVLIGLAK